MAKESYIIQLSYKNSVPVWYRMVPRVDEFPLDYLMKRYNSVQTPDNATKFDNIEDLMCVYTYLNQILKSNLRIFKLSKIGNTRKYDLLPIDVSNFNIHLIK